MGSSFWDVQRANKTKSWLLIALIIPLVSGLVYFAGYFFAGGEWILPIAIIFSLIYAAGGYFFGDKLVLAMHGARAADETKDAYLCNTIEGLALAAQIPKPKAYIIEDASPNAFATGRDPQHASIAVTSGLLAIMNRAELEGVLGHEMSHIKNFDSRFMTLTIVLVGLVAIIANMIGRGMWFGGGNRDRDRGGNGLLMIIGLLMVILAPILAQLVQLAISRSRERLADASAAQLTRNPEGLANALEKLKGTPPLHSASPTTAGLFISDPVHGGDKKGIAQHVMGLFSTHPPLDERIKALRAM
ncbi:Protease HtpX [uncultured archaeon]|nr:Protease HtpX [uncultured archaeon]